MKEGERWGKQCNSFGKIYKFKISEKKSNQKTGKVIYFDKRFDLNGKLE